MKQTRNKKILALIPAITLVLGVSTTIEGATTRDDLRVRPIASTVFADG